MIINLIDKFAAGKYGKWFGLLSRLILGGVLFAAGWLKIFTPAKSQMAVRAYEVLPISIANFLGIALPWLEVGLGVLLILGIAVRISAIFGGGLMVLFIAAISQAWARGLSIDCGCFGGGGTVDPSETKYLSEILRDTGLALLGLYLFRYPLTRFALEKLTKTEGE
ncbi:COG2259 Predicted membrane protein [Candidatus Nanopelagicaceae bacterium]